MNDKRDIYFDKELIFLQCTSAYTIQHTSCLQTFVFVSRILFIYLNELRLICKRSGNINEF